MLHLLTGETARKRVAVETDLSQDLAPVLQTIVQLQQLVFNLLLNDIEVADTVVDGPMKLWSVPGTAWPLKLFWSRYGIPVLA